MTPFQQRIPQNPTVLNKPQENFPTPTVKNKLLIEYVPMQTGSWQLLDMGSLYEAANHAPYVPAYDGYILVSQQPAFDNNSWFMRRSWSSPSWVDQEKWDFSYKYLDGDPNFPVVTRIDTVRRSEYQPLPPLTPDPDHPGALLTEEQMLNQTDPPDLNSEFVQVVRTYTTLPGPITLTQDFDTELNIMVWTSRQLVLADDIFQPEYEPLTLEVRESPASKYYKLRIHSYLQQLPDTFQGYQTGSFPFPNLLTGLTWDKVTIAPTPNPFSTDSPPAALSRAEVIMVPSIRPGPTTPALFKTITSYYVSQPEPSIIYAINPNDISYRGISVQMAINSVLNNSISLSVSFSNDGKYGNADDSYSIGPSTPSASSYTAAIGTYQTVASDITRWRGSIWVKRDQQVLLL